MDGTTIPSNSSGEMIAKTDYQWSVESIKTAFKSLAKTDFKIMKLIQTSEQQLCEFFVELLVHRPNDLSLTMPYVWIMITAFCELNWPSFVEIREKCSCTAYTFFKTYASYEPLSTGEVGMISRELTNTTASSKDGMMTQPFLKVVGRFKELKRGYDSLVDDIDIRNACPIPIKGSNAITSENKYVPK